MVSKYAADEVRSPCPGKDASPEARTTMYTGIDIGGTKTAIITADNDGNLLSRTAFPTTDCPGTLARIYEEVAKCGKTDAIGVSCGGPLDENRGVILSPPNLPDWDGIEIVDELKKRFGVPTALRNDANACALAEWQFGAGRGTKNMIFLTFGTGLGAGLILDGRLYSGTNGNAGEVGHMRLGALGGPVGYGKSGSFEGYCSGGGIRQLGQTMALEQLQVGRTVGYCHSMDELSTVNAKTIAQAADAGDPTAIEVYRFCGEKLGEGLSILIDLFNPEAIVIGSIFARSENLLRPAMEAVIEKNALGFSRGVCRVIPAALGEKIGDYAAIAVAQIAHDAI